MYGITWVSSPRHAIATHHEHFFFIRVSLCGYSLYGMVIRAIFLTILFFFLHLFILIFFFWLVTSPCFHVSLPVVPNIFSLSLLRRLIDTCQLKGSSQIMLFPHSQLISHLKASTLAFCKIASYAPRYFLFKNHSQSKRTLLLDLNCLEFH